MRFMSILILVVVWYNNNEMLLRECRPCIRDPCHQLQCNVLWKSQRDLRRRNGCQCPYVQMLWAAGSDTVASCSHAHPARTFPRTEECKKRAAGECAFC